MTRSRLLWLFLSLSALPGCSGVRSGAALDDTRSFSRDRVGHDISATANPSAVSALLAKPLTADRALQVALLANPYVRARLEEIGISEADLMDAATPRNPTLAASWRWTSGGQPDPDFGLMGDFLDWALLPLHKKIAQQQLAATQQRVCAGLLDFAAQVQTAFYELQGQQQALAALQLEAEAGDAMAEVAKGMHDAGNIPDLEYQMQNAGSATGRYQVMKAQAEGVEARATLNKLLGLSGADAQRWTISAALPPPPGDDLSPAHAESLALARRPDLEVARTHLAAVQQMLRLKQKTRLIPGLKLGVDTEHDPEAGQLTGPAVELEVPLFNWGGASVQKLQAEVRQATAEVESAELEVRSEARLAAARTAAARELWLTASQTLLPQRQGILKETLLHYNAMQKSNFELLQAKAEEQRASQESILALRDYWKARVTLEKAVGGRFSARSSSLGHDH